MLARYQWGGMLFFLSFVPCYLRYDFRFIMKKDFLEVFDLKMEDQRLVFDLSFWSVDNLDA